VRGQIYEHGKKVSKQIPSNYKETDVYICSTVRCSTGH